MVRAAGWSILQISKWDCNVMVDEQHSHAHGDGVNTCRPIAVSIGG